MTSHSPLIKLSFNQNFLIILNFLTRRWLCLHSFPQWLPKWWIYKWKLTVQMRLYGFIFIPSRLFLVRFTPFTRTVLLFRGVFWADFYLESRIQAVSFTGAPSARNAGWKKKQNRNAKQTPKQSSREIVIKKKPYFVPVFVSAWKFWTNIFWIWVETLWKLLLVYMRLKILKQVEKWHWKMLS